MSVVAELYPKWRDLKIHESSPGGPLSGKLARECSAYPSFSFFSRRAERPNPPWFSM
jgi:hypothetical protein